MEYIQEVQLQLLQIFEPLIYAVAKKKIKKKVRKLAKTLIQIYDPKDDIYNICVCVFLRALKLIRGKKWIFS